MQRFENKTGEHICARRSLKGPKKTHDYVNIILEALVTYKLHVALVP